MTQYYIRFGAKDLYDIDDSARGYLTYQEMVEVADRWCCEVADLIDEIVEEIA